MDRINTNTATPDRKFTDGDPTAGIRATNLNAQWFNGVQEELVNVIEDSGQILNPNDNTQVLKALGSLRMTPYNLQYEVNDGVGVYVQESSGERIPVIDGTLTITKYYPFIRLIGGPGASGLTVNIKIKTTDVKRGAIMAIIRQDANTPMSVITFGSVAKLPDSRIGKIFGFWGEWNGTADENGVMVRQIYALSGGVDDESVSYKKLSVDLRTKIEKLHSISLPTLMNRDEVISVILPFPIQPGVPVFIETLSVYDSDPPPKITFANNAFGSDIVHEEEISPRNTDGELSINFTAESTYNYVLLSSNDSGLTMAAIRYGTLL